MTPLPSSEKKHLFDRLRCGDTDQMAHGPGDDEAIARDEAIASLGGFKDLGEVSGYGWLFCHVDLLPSLKGGVCAAMSINFNEYSSGAGLCPRWRSPGQMEELFASLALNG